MNSILLGLLANETLKSKSMERVSPSVIKWGNGQPRQRAPSRSRPKPSNLQGRPIMGGPRGQRPSADGSKTTEKPSR